MSKSKDMLFTGRVTSKGQVTIPLDVRRHLNIRQGDRLQFDLIASGPSLRTATLSVKHEPAPFSKWRGALKGVFPGGTKEINAWIREMRGSFD